MTNQNVREWYSARGLADPYFGKSREVPYRSTVHLERLAYRFGFFKNACGRAEIVDVGCGTGSETAFLASRYPNCRFLGIDNQQVFVETAKQRFHSLGNLAFADCDLFNDRWPVQEGRSIRIWCSQVLSFLPWWEEALTRMCKADPEILVFSALAWDSDFESRVEHLIDDAPGALRSTFYNVYSTRKINSFMRSKGYTAKSIEPFVIDIDLPELDSSSLGSYTVTDISGSKRTFSLWQHMPWYFFVFSRE